MMEMNKRQLRAVLRNLHEGQAARDAQSAAISRHVLESMEYKSARVVGGYIPLAREADVLPVLQDALRQGKTLALPLCGKPPHMTLRSIRDMEELSPGAYGIPEPPEDAEIVPVEAVDLLLVPLEGIDRSGFRLGKGGGYYDCLLAQADVLTVGCALRWQWVDQLPRDSWDKPLRLCADAEGMHRFEQDVF